ncbi:MAG: hypothetical protein ACEPOW_09935 [Bacteroidales bacterium]
MENQNLPTQGGRPKKKINLTISVLLGVIAIVLLIWQFSTKSELNKLQGEKEQQRVALQAELDSLMNEHARISEAYDGANQELLTKDSIIIANAKKIKQALKYKYDFYKIKKKLKDLQGVAQGYVRKMDSLYRANEALVEENQLIKTEVDNQRSINDSLSREGEKLSNIVATAKELQTYNLKASGVKVRNSGREKETNRLRRIDKIRVCFTVAKNNVVEPGTKTIYMRLAAPNGEIKAQGSDDSKTFEYDGDQIQYSSAQDIDYTGDNLDLCLYYDKNKEDKWEPGIYNVDLFVAGKQIGQTTLELR